MFFFTFYKLFLMNNVQSHCLDSVCFLFIFCLQIEETCSEKNTSLWNDNHEGPEDSNKTKEQSTGMDL